MRILDEAVNMVSADAIRAYIATLRETQGYSQDWLAGQIGMARRTYIEWETGGTQDIKMPQGVKAIVALGGSLEHLALFDDPAADASAGERLAREWLAMTPEQRDQFTRLQHKFNRAVQLTDADSDRLIEAIRRLQQDARQDPVLPDLVLAYMDGRRSR